MLGILPLEIPKAEFVAGGWVTARMMNLTHRNVGLTRVRLGWEFESPGVSEDIYGAIDGYVVYAYPDDKSSPNPPGRAPEVSAFPGGSWRKRVFLMLSSGVNMLSAGVRSVDGFSVGGLGVYRGEDLGSDALVRVFSEPD